MTVSEQWPFVLERIDDKAHCQVTVTSMSREQKDGRPSVWGHPRAIRQCGQLCRVGNSDSLGLCGH